MKKALLLLLYFHISTAGFGQIIIADHKVVDRYDDIPQYYINEVKKMWLVYAGESHSEGIRRGLELLEAINPAYQVEIAEYTNPAPKTTSYLRADANTWGDLNNATGWIRWYGEEDWFTSAQAISRTKAGITHCNDIDLEISAFGFGWCYDFMDNVIFAGYLNATQQYIDYCNANGYNTKMFFTTAPVDNFLASGESGWLRFQQNESIRNYAAGHTSAILFDFADILCYNNGSETPGTATWDGHTFPVITSLNLNPMAVYHFAEYGALRLAKAMWWMLARMAGWDGISTVSTWQGVTADWGTPANWSGGVVPNSLTDVIISSSGNNPVISSTTSATCHNLVINSGASLTIESSSLTSSGSLIVQGTSTGNVTYNRVMPVGPLYRYITSPVSSVSLPSGNSYWRYNEPTGEWLPTGSYTGGLGYTMQGNGTTVSFTGSVVTSASQTGTAPYNSYADHYTDQRTDAGGEWGGGGWNLLGNPFTSAMNVLAFIDHNNGIIDGSQEDNSFDPSYEAVYIYDGANYYYIAPGNTGYGGLGAFPTYTDIQVGQGFFVLANYNNVPFSFTPEMRTHNTLTPMTKSAKANGNRWPGLQLRVKYGDKENSTLIVYNEKMTAGLDPGYDVGQLSAGPEVEVYTSLVGKDNSVNFAQQALPMTDLSKNIVPVGIDSEKGGEVIFSAFTVPVGNNTFWLEDRTTGIFTDLNLKSYTVTLPAMTYGTGRFFVYASVSTPTGIGEQTGDTEVRIWGSADKVIVKGEVGSSAVCSVFTPGGVKIIESNLTDGGMNIITMPSSSRGIYLVRVTDGINVYTGKVVFL